MQQRSFSKQCSSSARSRQKTRNQRKREFIKSVCLMVVAMVMCCFLGMTALKVWAEHPAEQPITYQQHMASIRGGEC